MRLITIHTQTSEGWASVADLMDQWFWSTYSMLSQQTFVLFSPLRCSCSGRVTDTNTHSVELFLWLCIGEIQGGRSWQSLSNRSFFLPLTDASLWSDWNIAERKHTICKSSVRRLGVIQIGQNVSGLIVWMWGEFHLMFPFAGVFLCWEHYVSSCLPPVLASVLSSLGPPGQPGITLLLHRGVIQDP